MRRLFRIAALCLTVLAPAGIAQAQDVGGSFSGPLGVLSGTATGTYTLGGTGNLGFSQTTNLSTAPASTRLNQINTTLSPSTNTTNVWENFFVSLAVSGPGQANGELNQFHGDLTVNAGGLVASGENFEAKTNNSGTLGDWNNYLALHSNGAAGTMTGRAVGTGYLLTNANAAAGSVATYAAINMEAMQGGGSLPTNYFLIRNVESNASLSTAGNVSIGNTAVSPNRLYVQGPDTSSGTFPVVVKNSGLTNLFLVADDGSAQIGTAGTATVVAGLSTLTGAATFSASLKFSTIADSATAPTIASGGCTTGSAQSIATNGTAAFDITLGGATCGSTITLTLPAATTKWHCTADDVTTPASSEVHQTGAASTTSVVLTNFVRTTGVAGNFTAADHLVGSCRGL